MRNRPPWLTDEMLSEVRAERRFVAFGAEKMRYLQPIYDGAEVVGFCCPRETKSGWRLGTIFIRPKHRGQGHAARAYAQYFDRALVAFVVEGNTASLRLHEKLGFVRWYHRRGQGWILRRKATC